MTKKMPTKVSNLMTQNPDTEITVRMTMTITEAAQALGIGRTLAYELARTGELPTIKLGRRLVVPRWALQRLVGDESRSALS